MTDIRHAFGLPPTDTLAYFRAKDFATQTHWDELWQQEHSRAFTVTKMLDADLLAKVRLSLDDVIAKGGTFEQWKKAIEPDLRKGGWWGRVDPEAGHTGGHAILVGERRLRTIFDTNLRTAQAAGQWAQIQKLKGPRPYLMWDAIRDRRTRPLHRLWGGLDDGKPIILPVDHPAWSIYFPPCGWGCRCGVIQLSERDLARRGLSVTSDAELVAKGWLTKGGEVGGNRKPYRRLGGQVEMVPAGIDPGFAYNPGEHYFSGLARPEANQPLPAAHPAALAAAPPMPEPRRRPASALLSPDTSVDEAKRIFHEELGGSSDGEVTLITDRSGFPIAVSDASFTNRQRSEKPNKFTADRVRLTRLLAETITDPDEIWTTLDEWPERAGAPAGRRMVKRYVARFEIDDAEPMLFFAVAEYAIEGGRAVWRMLSSYQKTGGSLARVRGGTLVYRRP